MSASAPSANGEIAFAQIPHPPFDPAYKAVSGFSAAPSKLDVEAARNTRSTFAADTILAKFTSLIHRDVIAPPVHDLSDNPVTIAIFETKSSTNKNRPVVIYCHGGGQVLGTRFFGVDIFMAMVSTHEDIVLASVEYRLAPEHRAPAGAYDCYAAAVYLTEHAAELGIDASKILIYGISGGAGPAAAACILARNRQYPRIHAQMLSIPMLDDRDDFSSVKQFEEGTNWTGSINRQAWDMILGPDRVAPTEVQVPARATDLSNLPPAFIDVGECEVFRDSAVAYATRIWSQGGSCELHVWPGMYHGGLAFETEVPVSKVAVATAKDYLERALGFEKSTSGQVRDFAPVSV
jgi:acetyl esterase/lipase